jgi:catechol 2,3-dioxygenase-like lactoylglutathione lyase family enzyme
VTDTELGRPPKGGWAKLAPELAVSDIDASLEFWRDAIGFKVAYHRPAERFAYLERDGAQIMLCQRNGRYETGPMQRPFGQGAMFQIAVADIAPVLTALAAIKWPLYENPHERWYRAGAIETGHRQFFVQDPDGYLLMLYQGIGLRPAQS